MSRRPRVPRTPPGTLTTSAADIVSMTVPLWRVHHTAGVHALPWRALRRWGPAANCRWEPHPEPAREHPGEGVLYCAVDLATAVLEFFQETRLIDPQTASPRATAWLPTRPLRLLDLTDDWCLRQGASAELLSAPRTVCRAWARRIRREHPRVDGLRTVSTLTGRPAVTLWAPSADAFPRYPDFSEPLAEDLLWDTLDRLALHYRRAGYRLI